MTWFERLGLTLLGVLFGWFLSRFSLIVSENATLIRAHIEDVQALTEAAQNYWLNKPDSPEEDQKLAALLKAKLAAVAVFQDDAGQLMTDARLKKYQLLQFRLYRTATGGDFEVKGRGIDPVRAIDANTLGSELNHLLRLAAREQVSLRNIVTLPFK